MKSLSIIIVSYNEQEFIEAAVQSCFDQIDLDDFEIIIGDDGSTDGSIEIIKRLQFENQSVIKYFVMDRDEGEIIPSLRVSNIIKQAISISEGDYFLILSADDLLLRNDRLSLQIKYLQAHPKTVACYTGFEKSWPDGTRQEIRSNLLMSRHVLWGRCYFHISCFVFRRLVFDQLLDSFCDDDGALFSIIKAGRIAYIDVLGFSYRQRAKSIMHESDAFELSVLALLLYQDIRNAGGYSISSLARFSQPLNYVYKNRSKLLETKYLKYRRLSGSKDRDILTEMLDNRLHKMWLLCLISKLIELYYRLWGKVLTVLSSFVSNLTVKFMKQK